MKYPTCWKASTVSSLRPSSVLKKTFCYVIRETISFYIHVFKGKALCTKTDAFTHCSNGDPFWGLPQINCCSFPELSLGKRKTKETCLWGSRWQRRPCWTGWRQEHSRPPPRHPHSLHFPRPVGGDNKEDDEDGGGHDKEDHVMIHAERGDTWSSWSWWWWW